MVMEIIIEHHHGSTSMHIEITKSINLYIAFHIHYLSL